MYPQPTLTVRPHHMRNQHRMFSPLDPSNATDCRYKLFDASLPRAPAFLVPQITYGDRLDAMNGHLTVDEMQMLRRPCYGVDAFRIRKAIRLHRARRAAREMIAREADEPLRALRALPFDTHSTFYEAFKSRCVTTADGVIIEPSVLAQPGVFIDATAHCGYAADSMRRVCVATADTLYDTMFWCLEPLALLCDRTKLQRPHVMSDLIRSMEDIVASNKSQMPLLSDSLARSALVFGLVNPRASCDASERMATDLYANGRASRVLSDVSIARANFRIANESKGMHATILELVLLANTIVPHLCATRGEFYEQVGVDTGVSSTWPAIEGAADIYARLVAMMAAVYETCAALLHVGRANQVNVGGDESDGPGGIFCVRAWARESILRRSDTPQLYPVKLVGDVLAGIEALEFFGSKLAM